MVTRKILTTLAIIVGAAVLAAIVVVTIATHAGQPAEETSSTVEQCVAVLQQQYPDEELADLWSACEETSK
ncbi:hypothetical protein EDF52_10278 [Curtobacterium sp. PhB42]|uniref:hypothetical protein n=1 Tax=unclassified Curtobacterium TaxID=257496 RepID=UPI001062F351|nr:MULTISPECIES: hypothetical protein [unclassified Curtobacterium]TDW50990.1 hypothetical protein EDF52_10278 [Curtobacterium sp. PhB42]TDW56164.1 hypothetical protein EDF47_104275 [Curtobacterium sp. PhB190]